MEQILRNVMPGNQEATTLEEVGNGVTLPQGTIVLAADDSPVARLMIERARAADAALIVTTHDRRLADGFDRG